MSNIDLDNSLISLHKSVDKLNKSITRHNSLRRTFVIGVVNGVGTVIGATVVAGVVLLILSSFIHTIDQIPLLGELIRSSQIEHALDKQLNK